MHRIELSSDWSVWRHWILRSAGFPAREVLSISMLDAPRLRDAIARSGAVADEVKAASVAARAALSELQRHVVDDATKLSLTTAIRALGTGRDIAPIAGAPQAVQAALAAVATARNAHAMARGAVDSLLLAERDHIRAQLVRFLDRRDTREAITWQNLTTLERLIEHLCSPDAAGKDNAKTRKYERVVASYLQRYCTKNDTIGFFGPVVWGTIEDRAPALALSIGPSLIRKRSHYFEYWCLDGLAEALSKDPALKPFIAPRRAPTVRVDGNALHYPIGRTAELPPEHARVLAALDGVRTAREIADALVQQPGLDFHSADDVYAVIEELVEQKLAYWTLEIPTAGRHPERALRTLLEVAGEEPRRRALAILDQLEHCRDDLRDAAGDPDRLGPALHHLETFFEESTGRSGTRNAGQTYGARTLITEECARDVRAVLGPGFLAKLRPLTIVLAAARWYTYQIALRYRRALEQVFRELGGDVERPVDLVTFWDRSAALFSGVDKGAPAIIREVLAELQARWSELVGPPGDARRLELECDELAPRAAQAFAAPGPGWPGARYQSPDVMLAASDVDAIHRGDFLVVLGELHAGANSLTPQPFAYEHDDMGLLMTYLKDDYPGPEVILVEPKHTVSRADHLVFTTGDIDVELSVARSWRPRSHVVAVADLVVRDVDGGLQVAERTGSRSFDIIAFFAHHLVAESLGRFSMFPDMPHCPRIMVDNLVIARERWRFAPQEIGFGDSTDPIQLVRRADEWARKHDIPRFVFVKVPEEPKPVFVDLDSLVYLEIFAKLVRDASTVSITEMLPGFEQLWLQDASGAPYTGELRFAMVDNLPWYRPGSGDVAR